MPGRISYVAAPATTRERSALPADIEAAAGGGRAIFLSYRLADSQMETSHIYQWLKHHGVPAEEIFLDERAIPLGVPFPREIEEAVRGARCVLVVVGPQWAPPHQSSFLARLARRSRWRDSDWVRREVELAMQAEGRTLPVLVRGAKMPAAGDLPPSLRPFHELQARELRSSDTGFEQDMLALARAMAERLVGSFDWTGMRFVYLLGARKTYLTSVEEIYRTFPLVVDADHQRDLPDDLEDPSDPGKRQSVYQKLKFRSFGTDSAHPRGELSQPEMTRASEAGEPVDNLQVVLGRGFRSLVILGNPGGGKTTLLRHTMRVLARQTTRSSDPLPIYIELPRLAPLLRLPGGERAALLTYFEQPEEKSLHGNEEYAPHVRDEVLVGKALLFLDGLDEVAPGLQDDVKQWIRERQRHLDERGALVVGTRFTGYDRRDFPQFAELVALEMDRDTRMSLASDLLSVLVKQFTDEHKRPPTGWPPVDTPAFEERIADFVDEMQKHELWRGNPLLFSLAAYVYVEDEDGGALPPSGIALYRRSITALLTKVVRRRHQAEPLADWGVLMEDTSRILAEVALRLYETQEPARTPAVHEPSSSPAATDTQSFTAQRLRFVLEQIPGELGLREQPKDMAPWVLESGTLEVVVAGQIYRFAHHTYQEYLAATALARRLVRGNEPLAGRARDIMEGQRFAPHWAEPMRMLAGALVAESDELRLPEGRTIAREWLADLMRQARNPQDDDRDAALSLAIGSLREISAIETFGPQVHAAGMLIAWAEALLRIAQNGPAKTLGALQRLAPDVAVLPESLKRPALDLLRAALADSAQPAHQIAAATALERMGDVADVQAMERLLLAEGDDRDARVSAARALARVETNALEHPGHAALERALAGADADLARLVASALVETADVEGVYRLILLAIAPGRDAEVRRLGALALAGAGDRARNTLQGLARDTDPAVAGAAMEVLGRLGEDFETLLPELTRMAEQGAQATAVAGVLASLLPYSLRELGFQGTASHGVAAIVPPVVAVPAGAFLMGSDKRKDSQAYDDELPQHRVALPAYQIAKFPVTVAEYACFVRAGQREPQNWASQLERLDHPVVYVSWHDATAYAAWLAKATGQPWRLPTEAEWEKAARGPDGRIYPWGDAFDAARCNTVEGGAGDTTPVGAYRERGDASPYGTHDMAGNVWEWTSSLFKSYPYKPDDGREQPDSTGSRVLRGGSWADAAWRARAAYRNVFHPVRVYDLNGFRLAASSAAAGS